MSDAAIRWVMECSPYRASTRLVHYALAEIVGNDFEFHDSTSAIAKHARVGRSSVTRALTLFVADGMLEVVHQSPGLPTFYRLLIPARRPVVTQVPGGEPAPSRARKRAGSRARTGARSMLATEETQPQEQQPHVIEPSSFDLDDRDAVDVVLDAWCESAGKRRSSIKRTPKRVRIIAAALRDYPMEDVLDAVRGWRNSSFHRGENDRATVYNSIELLLRDAEHIERFRDLERDGEPRPRVRVSQGQSNLDRLREMEATRDERRSGSNGQAHDRDLAAP